MRPPERDSNRVLGDNIENDRHPRCVSEWETLPATALIVKSAEGADVGCGERSEPHQTRRAEAMRFVPHRILRRCSVAHGRRYDQGRNAACETAPWTLEARASFDSE